MKKIIILLITNCLLISTVIASIKNFSENENIKASDINYNFIQIKDILTSKNTLINFIMRKSGDLIKKEDFELDFNKVRNLGINITPLQSETIKAEELNQAFLEMFEGVQIYNDIPLANNLSFTLNEDSNITENFSYINNVGLNEVQIIQNVTNGTITYNNNSFTYNPNPNYVGLDTFTYRIYDGLHLSNIATVSFTINPTNDNPTSNNLSFSTNEDSNYYGFLVANDIDNDNFTYSIVTQASKGNIVITNQSTGAFTYVPQSNQNGTDSFTFKVNDGQVDSNISTVSITINPINDNPITTASSFSTNEDTIYSGALLASDIENNPLTYSIVSQGTKGIVSITNPSTGAFNYIPQANQNGIDSFSFRVNDGTVDSNTSTVSVTINSINDAPVAIAQSLSTNEDTPINIILSGSDIENSPLSYLILSQPTNGTLTGTAPNLTYSPNSNFNGSDSFTFSVNDGQLNSTTQTIYITVNSINDKPQINGIANISVNQNSSTNSSIQVSDVDNISFTYQIVQNPTKGTITWGSNGNYTYTTALNTFGADSFIVRVSDGTTFSDNYTVNVTIDASGIILTAGTRTYFDGSSATSCNDYRTRSSGNYTYTGSTGSGVYSIKPDAGASFNVYCDMVTEGGGWTMIIGFYGNTRDMSYFDDANVGWKATNGKGTFNNTNLNYSSSYWSPAYARLSGQHIRISNGTDRATWDLPSINSLYHFVHGGGATFYSAGSSTSGFVFNSALSVRQSTNSTALAWRWNQPLKVKCQDGRSGSVDNAVLGFRSDISHSGYYCEGFGYPDTGNHTFRNNTRWYSESVNTNITTASNDWRSDTMYYNVWIK